MCTSRCECVLLTKKWNQVIQCWHSHSRCYVGVNSVPSRCYFKYIKTFLLLRPYTLFRYQRYPKFTNVEKLYEQTRTFYLQLCAVLCLLI